MDVVNFLLIFGSLSLFSCFASLFFLKPVHFIKSKKLIVENRNSYNLVFVKFGQFFLAGVLLLKTKEAVFLEDPILPLLLAGLLYLSFAKGGGR